MAGYSPGGNELEPGGRHRTNVWQGSLPGHNTLDDGWLGTWPVDAFEPDGYGLHNVTGNVWEWCADWFDTTSHATASRTDPRRPGAGTHRVTKGGFYLCHASYCHRYRVSARSSLTSDSTCGNVGFRRVRDVT